MGSAGLAQFLPYPSESHFEHMFREEVRARLADCVLPVCGTSKSGAGICG